MENFTKIAIGEPFPGSIPEKSDQVFLEIWPDSILTLIIRYDNLKESEIKAFDHRIKYYGYLEKIVDGIPLFLFIFNFPDPFGSIECSFNARTLIDHYPEYLTKYLTPNEDGGLKNALYIFLLDKNILTRIRGIGLMPESIKLFHQTLKKQIETQYTREQFATAMSKLFRYDPIQLFNDSSIFKLTPKGKR